MSGTIIGGKKAASTNYERHGEDFYKKIGKIGGKVSTPTGGFAHGDNGKKYGKIGGLISKRSRMITEDSKLRSDEISLLIPLGGKVITTLVMSGIITKEQSDDAIKMLYQKSVRNEWQYIFTDLTVGSPIQLAWKAVLDEELSHYKRIFSDLETEKTDKDIEKYRIIRNLVKAFDVATGGRLK